MMFKFLIKWHTVRNDVLLALIFTAGLCGRGARIQAELEKEIKELKGFTTRKDALIDEKEEKINELQAMIGNKCFTAYNTTTN